MAGGVEEEDGLAAMRLTRSSIVVTSLIPALHVRREGEGEGVGKERGWVEGRAYVLNCSGLHCSISTFFLCLHGLYIVFFALSPSLPLSRLYLLAYQFGSS